MRLGSFGMLRRHPRIGRRGGEGLPSSTPPGANASLFQRRQLQDALHAAAPDKAGDYNVTFGLAGYTSLSIPIHVSMNKENWYSPETATVEPNPVTAVLQSTTPQAKKR